MCCSGPHMSCLGGGSPTDLLYHGWHAPSWKRCAVAIVAVSSELVDGRSNRGWLLVSRSLFFFFLTSVGIGMRFVELQSECLILMDCAPECGCRSMASRSQRPTERENLSVSLRPARKRLGPASWAAVNPLFAGGLWAYLHLRSQFRSYLHPNTNG